MSAYFSVRSGFNRAGGEKSRLYLHSSPEFACKKLLAAGEERIFTFAHVFRNRERTALHHPEFTMSSGIARMSRFRG